MIKSETKMYKLFPTWTDIMSSETPKHFYYKERYESTLLFTTNAIIYKQTL